MKNYAEVLRKFQYLLVKENWPKILYVTPQMYWDIIIASESQIEADWHYDPTRVEDDGYPYFLIGPTMVRCTESPARKGLHITEFPGSSQKERFIEEWDKNDTKEGETDERITSEETPERSIRTEDRLDPDGVFPLPSTPSPVHGDEDVPETGSEDDSSG